MPPPKNSILREEYLRKNKERNQNPEYQHKHKESCQKRSQNPVWQRNHAKGMQNRSQNPEWVRKNKKAMRNRSQNWVYNQREAMQKLHKKPEWIRKNKEGAQKRIRNPEWIRKNKELHQNPEWKFKQVESKLGGFWYGNIRYPDSTPYCELWCSDLWKRIDKAHNYQSILSGKTKFENGGRALSRHHVYWQPKACCEWDEDTQGYYAMINLGTERKPNMYKHYIPGDPNKFVLLTMSEHQMIKKDKLKWIKIFENLIKTKLSDVCYLPRTQ